MYQSAMENTRSTIIRMKAVQVVHFH